MSEDREIQDTPYDRAAVALIAEQLLPETKFDPSADTGRVDAFWGRVSAPRAHDLSHEALDKHIARFAAPPAQGVASALARAHELLTLVSQFKAEADFLHHRVPVATEDEIFSDDL